MNLSATVDGVYANLQEMFIRCTSMVDFTASIVENSLHGTHILVTIPKGKASPCNRRVWIIPKTGEDSHWIIEWNLSKNSIPIRREVSSHMVAWKVLELYEMGLFD